MSSLADACVVVWVCVFVILSCFPCLNNIVFYAMTIFSFLIDCQIDSVILRVDSDQWFEWNSDNRHLALGKQWHSLRHNTKNTEKPNPVKKHWKAIRTFRIWLLLLFFSSISSHHIILLCAQKLIAKKMLLIHFSIRLPHLNFGIS